MCRWRVARACVLGLEASGAVRRVKVAVRSCEAVARRRSEDDWDALGMRQNEVMGAAWMAALCSSF